MARLLRASALAVVVTLAAAAPALATWSAPRTFRAPHGGPGPVAVNARGDVVAVYGVSDGRRPPTALRVMLAPAGGRLTQRVLFVPRAGERLGSFAVALDDAGEATVSWTTRASRARRSTLRAAFGSIRRSWAPPRVVAGAVEISQVALTVARDRTVLLTWADTPLDRHSRVGVAWRVAGHRFGQRATMLRPDAYYGEGTVGAGFDADGTAYLWSGCDGSIRAAHRGSRHFGPLLRVAPARISGFSLSVAGSRRGIASWIGTRCDADQGGEGAPPGPVMARTMRLGTFGPPVTLNAEHAFFWTRALAIPGDGAIVAWASHGPWAAGGPWFAAPVGTAGLPGAASELPDGVIAAATDGAGDVIMAADAGPVVVLAEDGGAPQHAPGSGAHELGAARGGRGFAVVWDPAAPRSNSGHLSLSVWRP